MSTNDRIDWLRLNRVPGIRPRTMSLLLARFESPGEVLRARGSELMSVEGVAAKLSTAITAAAEDASAEKELARCDELGIRVIIRGEPGYPRMLDQICDAPPVLYCQGDLRPADELAVAIVGSRRCSTYGRQQSERMAAALARAGITIISGLARGIDAAAHLGALAAGGRTLAVCATGLGRVYPPEHRELAQRMTQSGGLLSESPLDRGPTRGIFPQRNRIISGLALGVVIIEANRRSGALHTARHALEQGREVFAVPGRIDSPASEGCHDLIRDGVTLVRHPDDILEGLGPLIGPVRRQPGEQLHTPRELMLSEQERDVLNLLSVEPQPVDDVLATAPLDSSRVLATLTVLEMRRLVRRLPGGYVMRCSH